MYLRLVHFILILLLLSISIDGFSQNNDNNHAYTLEEIIKLSKDKSLASLQANTIKENKYWQWKTFNSTYKPQLSMSGSLPGFNRTFQNVQQNDGSIAFVPVSYNYSTVDLSLSQSIGLTGGEVFISSKIEQFKNFYIDQTQYSSKPTFIGIKQPLFSYNALRWDRKIQPLRYAESQKKFSEDIENVGLQVSALFFELLISQKIYDISKNNLANNDAIYNIGKVRYSLGKISENELLQLKLALINTNKAVAQAALGAEVATLNLKSFTGFLGEGDVKLILPDSIPAFNINVDSVLSEGTRKRSDIVSYKRRTLEAERDVAEARGTSGFRANLVATIGLSGRGSAVSEVYRNPANEQSFNIGFNFPILDWGLRTSKIKTAQANKKLVEYTIAQEQINFGNQIRTQVKQFTMNRELVKINKEANEIAQKRYSISMKRYVVGDLGITDLNIALQEKDSAQSEYLFSLKNFWLSYQYLKVLTLYDFKNSKRN
ncbi:hypothetical protein TH53_23780 [Pedobacter lusitanus]|uniref:TolC family protein n=2 Tax=Pedobacter lusitanus TaxID=1503925 RepID=A0A0D0EZX1_9SPHI|nr:hypothetical protein TH53_23780 [Pedobacter lusitanus]